MTEHAILPGLWPIPGDGVLARQGDLVLLIHPAGGTFTDRLLGLLTEVARTGGDGLRFTSLISAEFDADAASADPASGQAGPAVVAFGPAGPGTAVAVYGAAWADVATGYGAQRLTTGQPYGRLRSVLPSPLVGVSAGVQASAGGGETDPYMRLADGVVRAVGLVFAPAEPGQEPSAGQPSAGQPSAGQPSGLQPGAGPPSASPPNGGPLGAPASGLGPFSAPGLAGPAAGGGAPDPSPSVLPVGGPPIAMPPAPVPSAPPASEPFPELVEDQAPDGEYLATRLEPAVPAPAAPDPYAPQAETPLPGGSAEPESLIPGLPGDEVPGHGAQPPGTEPAGAYGASDLPTAMPAELPSSIPPAVVEGVFCANGHFNDPQAPECAVCGISMSQSPSRPQQGMRPPLGTLILDDGSMCQLDADCIIGREPTLDSAVAEGRARPLRITDASGVVSRMHAKVELDGWQAFITDLHSANGTQILRPGERHPTSLEPGVRAPLPGGTQIRLGGEFGLQYDARRHA